MDSQKIVRNIEEKRAGLENIEADRRKIVREILKR